MKCRISHIIRNVISKFFKIQMCACVVEFVTSFEWTNEIKLVKSITNIANIILKINIDESNN